MIDELKFPTRDSRAVQVVTALNDRNRDLCPSDRLDKYEKMAGSPFVFLRGSNHLFWFDMVKDERLQRFGDETTRTWLQGDLHSDNFGAFGNDEGQVVYNINDFDESVIADYQYDLWRMAVSIVLVARENDDLSADEQATVIDAFARSYLDTLRGFVGNDDERDLIFDQKHTRGRLRKFLEKQEKNCTRAAMLKQWTRTHKKGRRFDLARNRHRLAAVTEMERAAITHALQVYEANLARKPKAYDATYFKVKDVARRISAGTGSLGTPRYYVLIEGASDDWDDDRILDVKRQSKPTAYFFLSKAERVEYRLLIEHKEGQDAGWHEAGYRALARHTDDHLGWLALAGGFYSVRERSFFKQGFPTQKLDSKKRFKTMAEQWGRILATDHARSQPSYDEAYFTGHGEQPRHYRLKERVTELTDGRQDGFSGLVQDVAFAYADQVQTDWQCFTKALEHTLGNGLA